LTLFDNEGLSKISVPSPYTKAIEGGIPFFCVQLSANVLKEKGQ